MSKQITDWTRRSESFARIRAQIRQILASSTKPLDIAEIAAEFKLRFRYLPTLERRLRELVEVNAVRRLEGDIPKYELVREQGEA